MNRRDFLHLSLAGLGGLIATACVSGSAQPSPQPTPEPGVTRTPLPPLVGRGAVRPGTLLGNENVPGFYVRFIETFRAPDPGRWSLNITGLVSAPTTMTLDHIQKNLPFTQQNTRMKCVECWSSRADWGGFTYAALADLVKPAANATHLYFACEDGYYEVVPISELRKDRALFVTHMDGELIGAKYGAPLRMILPWLYGYKGAKTINTIEFRSTGGQGYWSDVGPYTASGIVLAGSDTPLDLDGRPRRMAGGEITDY